MSFELSTSPRAPKTGEPVSFKARICNRGDEAVEVEMVKLLKGRGRVIAEAAPMGAGQDVIDKDYPRGNETLNPDECLTLNFDNERRFNSAGEKTITAVIQLKDPNKISTVMGIYESEGVETPSTTLRVRERG